MSLLIQRGVIAVLDRSGTTSAEPRFHFIGVSLDLITAAMDCFGCSPVPDSLVGSAHGERSVDRTEKWCAGGQTNRNDDLLQERRFKSI
jgi:hypothetical protein